MKAEWLAAAAVTALLVVSFASGVMAPPASVQSQSQPAKRFGFGFIGIGGLITNGFTSQQFFDGMFLTPPYPSTVELTMQDNSGVGSAFSTSGNQLPFLEAVMQYASAYPNIQIVVHLGFNLSSSAAWNVLTTQFFPALYNSPYRSSIGAVGFDIEQTNVLTHSATNCSGGSCIASLWQSSLANMNALVSTGGWQFNSYYPQGISAVPNTGQYLFWQSSEPWAPQLTATTSNTVGINIGGNGANPWPSPGCDEQGNPHWSAVAYASGFTASFGNSGPCSQNWPATLDNVISTEASLPVASREWVIFYPGNNAACFDPIGGNCTTYVYSTGATGISDYFNWDNVAFRNAIWNDPNYRGNFLLGDVGQGTTTTTPSSTTATSSSTTTASSTSTGSTRSTSSSMTYSTSTAPPVTSYQGGSYTVASASKSVGLEQGASGSLQLTVTFAYDPFPPVMFTVSTLPQGTTVTFSSQTTPHGYVANAKFSTAASTPLGSYPLTIYATVAGEIAPIALQLDVQKPQPQTYYLSIGASPYGSGTTDPGAGIHPFSEGSTVIIAAMPASGWGFDHWVVDGNPAGNGSTIEVQMYSNNSVNAVFAFGTGSPRSSTVYFLASGVPNLTVSIDGEHYLLPASFSWRTGSEHVVQVGGEIQQDSVTRRVFLGWEGSVLSSSSTLSFRVTGNSSISPIFQSEFLVPVKFIDCGGTGLATKDVTIQGTRGSPVSLGAQGTAWLVGGETYQVAGLVWDNVYLQERELGGASFAVEGAGPVTVPLPVCSLSVRVTDIFGAVSGAEVYLSYSDGAQFKSLTNQQGMALFPQVPGGAYKAQVYYQGESASAVEDSTAGTLLQVTIVPILSLLMTGGELAAIASLLIVAAYLTRRLRRQRGGLDFFT